MPRRQRSSWSSSILYLNGVEFHRFFCVGDVMALALSYPNYYEKGSEDWYIGGTKNREHSYNMRIYIYIWCWFCNAKQAIAKLWGVFI